MDILTFVGLIILYSVLHPMARDLKRIANNLEAQRQIPAEDTPKG